MMPWWSKQHLFGYGETELGSRSEENNQALEAAHEKR